MSLQARCAGGALYLSGEAVLAVPGAAEGPVTVGIRPEGFAPAAEGPFVCGVNRVEVLGRDVSIVATHKACQADTLRVILRSAKEVDPGAAEVRLALNPEKVFLFDVETRRAAACCRAAALRREGGTGMERNSKKAWLYLLPALVLLAAFLVYPLIDVLVYSVEECFNFASQTYQGIGLYNYSYVLARPLLFAGG